MKIINRDLSAEQDGVPGYLAHPERKEPGPGLMIVHHHYGCTGNMKVKVCDYAKLGYTTIVPDMYKMLGIADGVHEAQKKTTDGQFVEILTRAWNYLTNRPEVDAKRCAVVGYCMGGRIGIHFAAATPSARAFVAYYPSVREEGPSTLRPRHPNDAVKDLQCPAQIFIGGQDRVVMDSRATKIDGKLPGQWPATRLALLSSRRSRFRDGRRRLLRSGIGRPGYGA